MAKKAAAQPKPSTKPKPKPPTKAKAKRSTKKPTQQPRTPEIERAQPSAAERTQTTYERHKERAAARQSQISEDGRDIATDLPQITDTDLRIRVAGSLRLFCELCLPERFGLSWSNDHIKALTKMERAVLDGGSFAIAMARGSGKTTMVIAAVLWAILCGHKKYVALIGCDRDAATKLLDGIKVELETNDILLDLFPEAVHPIRRLEGIANRCRGQLFRGERTYIRWTAKHIQFASIPANGEPTGTAIAAIIETAGIRGKIRGMQQALPTGRIARPDAYVVDDPQTDSSADSRKQVKSRLDVITGTCPGLAGPGQKISGFCTCTVIKPDDVADQLLNPQKFPDFQGERFKLIYAWPENTDLWEEYSTIYRESMAMGEGFGRCNAFVRKHWEDMHAGAEVAWDTRHRDDEVSALQHAYNLLFRLGDTFWSEYQNQPTSEEDDEDLLSVDQIQARTNGYERYTISPDANLLTTYIDVQGECLYYVVLASQSRTFSGWIVDYGAWPKQTAVYFTKRTLNRKLSRHYPGAGREGRIKQGILDLVNYLCTREWLMLDQTPIRISQIGIDAAWGPATRIVQAAALESPHRSLILPTFGRALEAKDLPMELWTPKPGEQLGIGYSIRPRKGGGTYGLLDVNYWKSFVHSRFSTSPGDKGSLTLFAPELVTTHRMLAEHCRSETRSETVYKANRTVQIWTQSASRPDNDLFDCIAGAFAMAGIKGARLGDLTVRKTRQKKRRETRLVT
jgi:hypothetical protein